MAEPRHWLLVIYDVRDPKRLRRTHKTMKAWGVALQYSVFRVRGTQREIERMRFELAQILEPEDALMIARLCDSCSRRVSIRGRALPGLGEEVPSCRIV